MNYSSSGIAIVGIGGVFPGAAKPENLWNLIVSGQDASIPIPPHRWIVPADQMYAPQPGTPDKARSQKACLITDFQFDPSGFNLEPEFLMDLDPMFHIGLHAAKMAIHDAGEFPQDRTGVIIGNIALPTSLSAAYSNHYFKAILEETAMKSRNTGVKNPVHPVNCAVAGYPAGLIAQAFHITGGAKTLDAACAASLYALKLAADELVTGRLDAVLTGGMALPDSMYTQMGFSQLRAVSPSGCCAPFSDQADGLVVGEGAGFFVLMRLGDALKRGCHIYGVIKGIGVSNDIGGSLFAPDSEGQLRSMTEAYQQAGWQPEDVDLIECHATGTPVGDAVEFASLQALWKHARQRKPCVIGGVKSNIGHLLTGAGAAGLMKVLLAMEHRQLPPTANFQNPSSSCDLARSPFSVLTTPENWSVTKNTPRRAAVSAFGFGGINAHVLVEEWTTTSPRPKAFMSAQSLAPEPVVITSTAISAGGIPDIAAFQQRVFSDEIGNLPGPLAAVTVPATRFRIPPTEIQEMLPQQILMLTTAADALENSGWLPENLNRTGIFIGIALDMKTNNYHFRWLLQKLVAQWVERKKLNPTPKQAAQALAQLRDAFHPALTANRVMGSLGGIVASRIARQLKAGGPSFTISSEDTSGIRALETAVRLLQDHTIDQALAGAVDLAADFRTVQASRHWRPETATPSTDLAAAVVLKRLSDAQKNNDPILAVIGGVGSTSGPVTNNLPCSETIQAALNHALKEARITAAEVALWELTSASDAHTREELAAIENARTQSPDTDMLPRWSRIADRMGHSGAAHGFAALIRATLSLSHQILPSGVSLNTTDPAGNRPLKPQYWLPGKYTRAAAVTSFAADGTCAHVILKAESAKATAKPALPSLFPTMPGKILFRIQGTTPAELESNLEALLQNATTTSSLHALFLDWHQNQPAAAPLNLAITAESLPHLQSLIPPARNRIRNTGPETEDIFFSTEPAAQNGRIAFVYPGSGTHFPGMGRSLALAWPGALKTREHPTLHRQFQPDLAWQTTSKSQMNESIKDLIIAQTAYTILVTDILRHIGIQPDIALGYSLGESAALFALNAWKDRSEMLRRLDESPLFTTDLAGPCQAARAVWNLKFGATVQWQTCVVRQSAENIKPLLEEFNRVYLMIVNTPEECVIGGDARQLKSLLNRTGWQHHMVQGVSTNHCPVVEHVKDAYLALHRLPVTPPPGITFFSTAGATPLKLTMESVAQSITRQARRGFDFPALITAARAHGATLFIEPGPGNSCTRMIREMYPGTTALSLHHNRREDAETLIRLAAQCIAEGVPVNMKAFFSSLSTGAIESSATAPANVISVPVGLPELHFPTLESILGPVPAEAQLPVPAPTRSSLSSKADVRGQSAEPAHRGIAQMKRSHHHVSTPASGSKGPANWADNSATAIGHAPGIPPRMGEKKPPAVPDNPGLIPMDLIQRMQSVQASQLAAHEAFLAFSKESAAAMQAHVQLQMTLLQRPPAQADPIMPDGADIGRMDSMWADPSESPQKNAQTPFMDHSACMEFAIGSAARVLGPDFAPVDHHPTRVRLPDEPLMLVDRILTVQGQPKSMGSGQVVTEHDILPDAWYLDCGKIPTCIAVEAGQADLFLSGFLGIDFVTQGQAVYRLLDAVVTFHRHLPGPGDVIRYEIAIDRFFRQGDTHLFRFRYEASVDGERFLTMRDGCAGFFTQRELDAGEGLVFSRLDQAPKAGRFSADWIPPVPLKPETYSVKALDRLRDGDLAGCFGAEFARLNVKNPQRLPGGRMRLIDEVSRFDPAGGKYGIGLIRGEAAIHPDDWFLTCHFVDDQVMPGTLMYECSLHTFRVMLLRMGFVDDETETSWEPVPDIAGRLKCRGQVIASTKQVSYEVALKELGFNSAPYAVADAVMYADGRPVVEMTDMSLQLRGSSLERLQQNWQNRFDFNAAAAVPAVFGPEKILAFAVGKPSDAFGEPYRVFDADRIIARLPGPPYWFLDRVIHVDAAPWEMQAGGKIRAAYDVPPDEWYFADNGGGVMPFAVLLEIALQPCGWFSAYMGSALLSDTDLKYRNLGGHGEQFMQVEPDIGTLLVDVEAVKVAAGGGTIIQHFEFAVRSRKGLVYKGDTYFGFFTAKALAEQVGIRGGKIRTETTAHPNVPEPFPYPSGSLLPSGKLAMLDTVTMLNDTGGPAGLGFAEGIKIIDPEEWFFKAHFYQDPVWPGSLGLEAMLHLVRLLVKKRWSDQVQAVPDCGGTGIPHEWTYRGQVIQQNQKVTVQTWITHIDDERKIITADGLLAVDGLVIYEMKQFAVSSKFSF